MAKNESRWVMAWRQADFGGSGKYRPETVVALCTGAGIAGYLKSPSNSLQPQITIPICKVQHQNAGQISLAGFNQGIIMELTRRTLSLAVLSATALAFTKISPANASVSELNHDSYTALKTLFAEEPNTKIIAADAKGILIFPRIVKAGIVVGGQSGDGTLIVNRHVFAHYNISGGSVGLQVGAQTYSYALFFMNESALSYLENSSGWSIGSGPSVVALDKSAASSWTAAGASAGDVYAIPFSASGLMASLSLEGTKITRIHPGS